jgi:hypothetical protein
MIAFWQAHDGRHSRFGIGEGTRSRRAALERQSVGIATQIRKSRIFGKGLAGRLMILVAPEGLDKSIFDAAISQASDEAEKLEIAAITAEAALEDSK